MSPGRLRKPHQVRSQQTLERIVAALEALLGFRDFEAISVAEITKRAGTSVGAFYARFTGKDALLPLLYERYGADLERRMEALVAGIPWDELDLRGSVERLVRLLIEQFRGRRGLMRAVGLFARQRPDAISRAMLARRAELHRRIAGLLLLHRAQIRHPDPELAVEMGLFAVAAACRDKILFPAPHARTLPEDDELLRKEMSSLLLAYLTWKDELS